MWETGFGFLGRGLQVLDKASQMSSPVSCANEDLDVGQGPCVGRLGHQLRLEADTPGSMCPEFITGSKSFPGLRRRPGKCATHSPL